MVRRTLSVVGQVARGIAPFDAVVSCSGRRVVVALHGELDMAGLRVLDEVVKPLVEAWGLSVRLDASDLAFLDAAGLRGLVELRALLRARGGELTIGAPSPPVHRILDLCGHQDLLSDGPVASSSSTA